MDWRKSSYSGANGGQCIEIASDGAILVRDTADRGGVVLMVDADAFRRFAASLK